MQPIGNGGKLGMVFSAALDHQDQAALKLAQQLVGVPKCLEQRGEIVLVAQAEPASAILAARKALAARKVVDSWANRRREALEAGGEGARRPCGSAPAGG